MHGFSANYYQGNKWINKEFFPPTNTRFSFDCQNKNEIKNILFLNIIYIMYNVIYYLFLNIFSFDIYIHIFPTLTLLVIQWREFPDKINTSLFLIIRTSTRLFDHLRPKSSEESQHLK